MTSITVEEFIRVLNPCMRGRSFIRENKKLSARALYLKADPRDRRWLRSAVCVGLTVEGQCICGQLQKRGWPMIAQKLSKLVGIKVR